MLEKVIKNEVDCCLPGGNIEGQHFSCSSPQATTDGINIFLFFLVFLVSGLYSVCSGLFGHGLYRKWMGNISRDLHALVNCQINQENNFSHLSWSSARSTTIAFGINFTEYCGFGRFFETFGHFGQNYLIWKPGILFLFILMAYSVRFFYGLKMFVSLNVILFCNQGQKIASSNLTLVSSNWTLEKLHGIFRWLGALQFQVWRGLVSN